MTTYLLLALHDDGRSEAYDVPPYFTVNVMPLLEPQREPVASGNDRGPYQTYEVAGFSIDVAREPEAITKARAALLAAGTEAMRK